MTNIKEDHHEDDELADDAPLSDCNTINMKLILAKPDHSLDQIQNVEDTDSKVYSEIYEYNGFDHEDEGKESLDDFEEDLPELMDRNLLIFGDLIFLDCAKRVNNSYNRRYIEPVIKDQKYTIIVVSEVIVDTPSL